MASIVLPTYDWTDSCESLRRQLGPDDELLVAVDSETDPAVEPAEARTDVDLVIAGEPDGCSGKCNAMAAGLERASHDVLVITDSDVPRDDDWLDRVKAGVADHGAVTGAPMFVYEGGAGRPLGWLLEPVYALNSLGILVSDGVWGGAAGFRREHVDSMDDLCADLRRTVTDDLLIGEHLTVEREADFDLASPVPVTESIGGVLDRLVRYTLSVRYSEDAPLWLAPVLGLVQLVALALFPLGMGVAAVLGAAGVYGLYGARRWTVLFAPVTLVVHGLLSLVAIRRTEFTWGGRRYRWTDQFEVEILEG